MSEVDTRLHESNRLALASLVARLALEKRCSEPGTAYLEATYRFEEALDAYEHFVSGAE